MTKHLDFTLTMPSNISSIFPVPDSTSPATEKTDSLSKKIIHFLADPNDAPEYGYQDSTITGIGFWMMHGARFAISVYNEAAASPSAFHSALQKMAAISLAAVTSPFTAIGVLLKGVGSKFPHRVENLTSDQIPTTASHKIDQIYEILQILNDLFRENNIKYSMISGTLLGAIRDKGIIPWDDDGDIYMMKQDKDKFLTLKDKLMEKGICVQDTGFDAYKLTFDAKTLNSRFSLPLSEAANVDISLVEEDAAGKVWPVSEYLKHTFPSEYFLKGEFDQLRDYPFGPPDKRLFLKGPTEPMRYLKTHYGPECFEYALRTHSHIQVGPFPIPILNFSRTRYKIVNPTFAVGNQWKNL